MEEQDQELIERYFRNALSTAEQAEVERRAASDAGFRLELEAHRKARQAVRLQEKKEVLEKLAQRGRELDAQEKQNGGRHRWWLAGSLILLLALLAWWQWNGKPAVSKQETPPILSRQDSTQRIPPPDTPRTTAPPNVPAVKKPENQPPVASRDTRERLFAAHFKPYKDESLEPSLRGDDPPPPPEKFRQLYWDGQYPEALAQFENLPPAARENDNELFIKAECLLTTGSAGEAARIFELILKNDRSRYTDAAAWHLALAYLKTGDVDRAKSRLQKISRSGASPWRADAAALLKNIQ